MQTLQGTDHSHTLAGDAETQVKSGVVKYLIRCWNSSASAVGVSKASDTEYGVIARTSEFEATESKYGLAKYETTEYTTSIIGGGSGTFYLKLVKGLGGVVNGIMSWSITSDADGGQVVIDGAVPEEFYPIDNIYFGAPCIYNNQYDPGKVGIFTYGRVNIWAINSSQNWAPNIVCASVSPSGAKISFSYLANP